MSVSLNLASELTCKFGRTKDYKFGQAPLLFGIPSCLQLESIETTFRHGLSVHYSLLKSNLKGPQGELFVYISSLAAWDLESSLSLRKELWVPSGLFIC